MTSNKIERILIPYVKLTRRDGMVYETRAYRTEWHTQGRKFKTRKAAEAFRPSPTSDMLRPC